MALGTPTYLAEKASGNSASTTGAFTPTAGATLLVGVAGRLTIEPTGLPEITDSLTTHLAWQEVEYGSFNAGNGFRTQLTVFRATVGASPVSMTVTGTVVGAAYTAVTVLQITGSNPTIANFNNNTALGPTVTTVLPSTPAATSTVVSFYLSRMVDPVTPDATYTELRETVVSTALMLESAYDAGSADSSATFTSTATEARCVLILIELTQLGGQSASGGGALTGTPQLGGRGTGAHRGGGVQALAIGVGGGGTAPPTVPGPGPDPGIHTDNVHHANVRLGGRGGRTFIPVQAPIFFRGIADLAFYEVSIQMAPGSKWILPDARAITIERSLNTWPGGLEAGTAEIVLDDASGRYWPAKSGIRPNMPVQVLATFVDPDTSIVTSYHLFNGLIDAITSDTQLADRTVQLTCRDSWKLLQSRLVTTSMMINWPVASILAHGFNQSSIDPSQRSIDTITDVLPFAWARNVSIASFLDEYLSGGGYGAYVSNNGIVRVRDRYFDAGGTFVPTAVYTDVAGLTLSIDDADLVNRITASGIPSYRVDSMQPVAAIREAIWMRPGTMTTLYLEYQDPRGGGAIGAYGSFQFVANSDYALNTASDGTGTNLLSTMSLQATFYADRARITGFNPHAFAAYITAAQVRSLPILESAEISVTITAASSTVAHSVHDATIESNAFATHALLERRGNDVLEQFATPLLRADLSVIDDLPTAFKIELSNIVIITNSHAGLDAEQFTVFGITHELRADDTGIVHQMGLSLHRAREIDAFILDTDHLDIDRLSR